jgi:CheY-like chemotaxis protein
MSSGKRILVIEDDTILASAIRMVLQWEGYCVDCAANGLEALNRLRQPGQKPDLILLDVLMPVLNGQQFRYEQKRDPALSSIPVVVISASDIASSLDNLPTKDARWRWARQLVEAAVPVICLKPIAFPVLGMTGPQGGWSSSGRISRPKLSESLVTTPRRVTMPVPLETLSLLRTRLCGNSTLKDSTAATVSQR